MAQLVLEFGRGDVLANRYEVVERIDESPLGISYRVRNTQKGTYARVQLIDPRIAGRDQKDALMAAFRTAQSVKHKNLLPVTELDAHGGVALLAMEDFEGQTLREVMNQRRTENSPFTLREAAQIAIQILEGVRALHDAGVIVRGLRPENVLIAQRRTGPRGTNVLYEVRIAGGPLWPLVPPGVLAEEEFTRGDAQYLAPELKTPDPVPTVAADVYSVGVIFYELLVGSPPVGTWQLPRARRSDLPQKVDDITEIALAAAPTDRYPSAADFSTDVQRSFSEGEVDEALVETSTTSRVLGVLGVIVVVAASVLVWFRTGVDPFEQALTADNLLRKEVYEAHSRPGAEEVREILAKHPANMMYVPPGPFLTGRFQHEDSSLGGAKVERKELEGFLIDVFEYPNLASGPPKHGVSYTEAARLCAEAGKRLCSSDEWEKACRGPENYVYSYGDTFDEDFCGKGLDDPHLAGALPECKSSWGVYDISGNLREWTSTERESNRHVVRGGLAQAAARGTRCAFGTDLADGYADPTISFRCCRDVNAPPAPVAPPPAEEAAPAEPTP